jgi:hypothetical protein
MCVAQYWGLIFDFSAAESQQNADNTETMGFGCNKT